MDTGNIGGWQSMTVSPAISAGFALSEAAPHRPPLRIAASVASHDVGISRTSGSTHFRSLVEYRRLPGAEGVI